MTKTPKNRFPGFGTLGDLYDQAASPPPFLDKPLIFQVAMIPLVGYVPLNPP